MFSNVSLSIQAFDAHVFLVKDLSVAQKPSTHLSLFPKGGGEAASGGRGAGTSDHPRPEFDFFPLFPLPHFKCQGTKKEADTELIPWLLIYSYWSIFNKYFHMKEANHKPTLLIRRLACT